jgi:hypothetical protein
MAQVTEFPHLELLHKVSEVFWFFVIVIDADDKFCVSCVSHLYCSGFLTVVSDTGASSD